MSFIQPSGEVRILKGYTGDKGYNHTVRFDSRNDQYAYFSNLIGSNGIVDVEKFNLTQQKYTNYTARSIRVPYHASTYFSCNYLMFRSTSADVYEQFDRWYYAFIDRVEYINNNLCEIFYTLDIIQSWYFDYKLTSCFVEREHSLTDNLFENLVEEDLEVGDYIVETRINFNINGTHDFNNTTLSGFCYRVFLSQRLDPNHSGDISEEDFKTTWSVIDGVLVPYSVETFFSTNKLTEYLSKYISNSKTDAIITVLCTRNYGESPTEHSEEFYMNIPTSFDGYTPKNKKMYNYPFIKIGVTNNTGSSNELKPELFIQATNVTIDNAKIRFMFIENANTTAASAIVPVGYRKVSIMGSGYDELDFSNAVIFDQYPSLPWSKDALSTWLISNQNQARQNIANSILSYLGGSMSKASNYNADTTAFQVGSQALTGAIDVTNKISMIDAKIKDLKAIPPQASVNSLSSPLLLSDTINRFGFTIDICVPHAEYAEICDNYLSMFGYSVKRVKLPNLALTSEATLRPRWNYLKTLGCHVISSSKTYGLPAEIASQINAIYDKGITFWNTEYNGQSVSMYNYDADNYAQPQTRRID